MSVRELRPRPTAPIVPVAPYQRAMSWLPQQGIDVDELLREAAIPKEQLDHPRGLLTIDQVERMTLMSAAKVDRRGRTLELGSSVLFPSYGAVGLAALTAPTVERASFIAEKYLELITPLFVIERERHPDTLRVRLFSRYRLHPYAQQIHIEFVMSTVYRLVQHGVGQVPGGMRLSLPIDDPALVEWLEEGGVEVVRSTDTTLALDLPLALADTSFVMADAAAHAGFVAQCDVAMAELSPNDPTTRAVQTALRSAGPPFPSLLDLSKTMGASTRTLRRRLKQEGTGYQELLDEARFSWATRALRDSSRPVTAIAYDLGYSAPSNFTRAFRNAMGTSPSEYRSEHETVRPPPMP